MRERAVVIIKPHVCKIGGEPIADILTRWIVVCGASMINFKWLKMDKKMVRAFYKEHLKKPFYPELEKEMTSGTCLAALVEGDGIIEKIRKLNGPTDPSVAPPDTLRGKYGVGVKSATTAVHCSDSRRSGKREAKIIFGRKIGRKKSK